MQENFLKGRLCIGTAQFGMPYGIANQFGQVDFGEVTRIVKAASENDIWFYDTAQSYGDSEDVLGRVFLDLKISDKTKCITKLSPDFVYTDYHSMKSIIEKSLNNLKIKSIWGLLIHRPKIGGNWSEFLSSIKCLKDEKLIEHFGVSIYEPSDALRFVNDRNIEIIQVPFNVMDGRLIANNFFDIAKRKKKIIFIRSVYLQGLLLMDKEQLRNKDMVWTLEYLRNLYNFVEKHQLDIKSFVLNLTAYFNDNATVIVGIESLKQLEENIKIIQDGPLPGYIIKEWFTDLNSYPEKFLNPSLW